MKYSEFPQAVIKENVDYTVREITNVIKRYGPRESGNENCYAVQKHIKKEMDTFCDETGFEEYKIAPKAFLHFTKTCSLLTIIAIVVPLLLVFLNVFSNLGSSDFFIPQCIVGVAVIATLFTACMQLALQKPFCDAFYKKKDAHNFYAVRKPRGEVKKRIVISGNVDASYEWRHTYYGKNPLMSLLTAFTCCFVTVSAIIAILATVANFVDMGAFGEFMLNYSYYFHILTALAMITLFFFVDFKTISPGANDNLTGTYAALCALRMLDMAGAQFENTEVVALISDGEKAGLKGTKAWAKAHKEEYTGDGVETAVLCVGALADDEVIHIHTKDKLTSVKNDKGFGELVNEAGKEAELGADYSAEYLNSSSAAAFSKSGITATALDAIDKAKADFYNNRLDNYDRLSPDAIEAGYKAVMATIFKFNEK